MFSSIFRVLSNQPAAWYANIRISWLPIFIGLLATLPYAQLLFSGGQVLRESLYSDYGSFQLPIREFVKREFAEGRFPIWNPWLGCGIPFHATGQVGLTYPLMTPLLLVADANRAIQISLFLHVILCYCGQYRLGRHLGLSQQAASIGGLIVVQSGFLTTHLVVGHVMLVIAYGIYPWFFLGVCRVCRGPTLASISLLAIPIAGMFLAGHPQLPYYGFLFGGFWSLGSMAFGVAANHRLKCLFSLLAAGGLGITISSVQFIPMLELVADAQSVSERGTVTYAAMYSLEGVDLYRLLFPFLGGCPTVGIPEFMPPDFYHEKVCYLGIATWFFAFSGLYASRSCRWPIGAALLVAVALIIALGQSTPFFAYIGSIIPGFFLFRCPGRCLGMLSVLVALLAGFGFDSSASERVDDAQRSTTWLDVGLLVAMIGAMIIVDVSLPRIDLDQWMRFAEHHLRFELNATGLVVLTTAALMLFRRQLSTKGTCVLAVSLLLADLGYFNLRHIKFEDRTVDRALGNASADGRAYRFIEGSKKTSFASNQVRYSRLVPLSIGNGLPMVGTNEGGVLPKSIECIFQALERNPVAALNLSSCRYFTQSSDRPSWQPNPTAEARIRFLPGIEITDLQTSLTDTASTSDSLLKSSHSELRVLVDTADEIEVSIANEEPGVMVVADTFYPGWNCEVDGSAAEIRKVYGCYRGVILPQGNHTVRMRYRPYSFRLGCWLSISGVVIWLALACFGLVSARRSRKYGKVLNIIE